MPQYDVTAPDGKVYSVNAPEGATQDDAIGYVQKNLYKPNPKAMVENDAVTKGAKNFASEGSGALGGLSQAVLNGIGGFVRGAGSIGATIARPFESAQENEQRRAGIDQNMQSVGAQPDSWMYKGGRLGGEIAGTAGAGGVLASGVRALGSARALTGLEPIVSGVAKGLETGGFRVGELAGTGAGGVAARLGAGAVVGGAAAGMTNPEEAGMGALIGGALPGATQLAGKAGMGLRKAIGDGATPEVVALASRAKELGINIPADRLTNSRPMNAVAAGLNYVPLSGRAATEDAMNSQLNRALSKTFGQDSPNVTMALRKADDQLGGQFDKFLQNNTVKVDQKFMADLAEAGNQASRELGSDGASIISKQVEDILAKAVTGEIDGQAAYNIKKTLDRIGKRNSPEAYYAIDLKQKLMSALDRSVGQDQAKAFSGLRTQYGNMLNLEKLAKNGAEGEISVARLANMKNINNPQMQELADIAAQFVKPREGQHGSAQRAAVGAITFGLGGFPGLLAGASLGRGSNTLLNSDAARNLVLGKGLLAAEPEALGLLTQSVRRTAPLLPSQ